MITNTSQMACTAFEGFSRYASGSLSEVGLAVKRALDSQTEPTILIFDDQSGRVLDVDFRGTPAEVEARLARQPLPFRTVTSGGPDGEEDGTPAENRGRGRPKLGVMAREVTLLPRHWDWLNSQPGGASVALRKLVEEARRTSGDGDRSRAAQEAAYHFMSAIAGDLPGYEEATRALFAYDRRRFSDLIAGWPEDVRDHAVKLAFADLKRGS